MPVQTSGYRKIPKLSVDELEVLTSQTQTGTQAITGALTVTSNAAATVPLTVVAHASQSANVFEAKTSGGAVGVSIGSGAASLFATQLAVGISTVSGVRGVLGTLGDATKGFVVRQNSGTQSAVLFETQTSAGASLFGIAGNGRDFILDSTTGTKIGTATTQKLGFYNATPIVQPGAYTQTFATADKTHAARTATTLTAASGTADGTVDDVGGAFNQTTLNNNFQECATRINQLIADLADTAGVVNALVDDLQALGLAG